MPAGGQAGGQAGVSVGGDCWAGDGRVLRGTARGGHRAPVWARAGRRHEQQPARGRAQGAGRGVPPYQASGSTRAGRECPPRRAPAARGAGHGVRGSWQGGTSPGTAADRAESLCAAPGRPPQQCWPRPTAPPPRTRVRSSLMVWMHSPRGTRSMSTSEMSRRMARVVHSTWRVCRGWGGEDRGTRQRLRGMTVRTCRRGRAQDSAQQAAAGSGRRPWRRAQRHPQAGAPGRQTKRCRWGRRCTSAGRPAQRAAGGVGAQTRVQWSGSAHCSCTCSAARLLPICPTSPSQPTRTWWYQMSAPAMHTPMDCTKSPIT